MTQAKMDALVLDGKRAVALKKIAAVFSILCGAAFIWLLIDGFPLILNPGDLLGVKDCVHLKGELRKYGMLAIGLAWLVSLLLMGLIPLLVYAMARYEEKYVSALKGEFNDD